MGVFWPVDGSYILVLFLICAATAIITSYYEYRGIGPQDGIVRRGPRQGGKRVSITFDDGPSPEFTPQVLDILGRYGVKATFFVIGRMAEQHPDIIRRMAQEGHDIGNHTYHHFNLILLDQAKIEAEIAHGEAAITAITGRRPELFRPPRGLYTNKIRRRVLERGYRIILWTVSAADWGPINVGAIIFRVMCFTRRGSIILFHDGGAIVRRHGGSRRRTVKALPVVIERLRRKGFEIIPVSEMLELEAEDGCLDKVS